MTVPIRGGRNLSFRIVNTTMTAAIATLIGSGEKTNVRAITGCAKSSGSTLRFVKTFTNTGSIQPVTPNPISASKLTKTVPPRRNRLAASSLDDFWTIMAPHEAGVSRRASPIWDPWIRRSVPKRNNAEKPRPSQPLQASDWPRPARPPCGGPWFTPLLRLGKRREREAIDVLRHVLPDRKPSAWLRRIHLGTHLPHTK